MGGKNLCADLSKKLEQVVPIIAYPIREPLKFSEIKGIP
jgi:hypothetical protein